MPSEFIEQLARRIEGEYLEMPGLQLTSDQARRLWAVDPATCALVLDTLVQSRFLIRGADDRYRRASDGSTPKNTSRQARADLRPRDGVRRAS